MRQTRPQPQIRACVRRHQCANYCLQLPLLQPIHHFRCATRGQSTLKVISMVNNDPTARPPRSMAAARSDSNLVARKGNVPAVRAGQDLAPVSARLNAGSAVPVTFPDSATADFSVAYESFVSGFVLRRYKTAAAPSSSPPPATESAQQSKTDPEPHAIVALGEFGDLAVVLARALNATADAHQSFFRSGGGRTIHPSGFEIVGVRTLMIPRSIMRELVNRPTDPRELYVLAAAILPTNSLSPEPPEIRTHLGLRRNSRGRSETVARS